MSKDDQVVMWRDASFWDNPGRASKYHLLRKTERGPYGHKVATCNRRIQLNNDNTTTVADAGNLMCKRCAAKIQKI